MDTHKVKISEEVIDAINGELNYQNKIAGTSRADTRDNGVSGQLVALVTYTQKAINAWALNCGDKQALEELRKVAAIAIRALEIHGCPKRKEI